MMWFVLACLVCLARSGEGVALRCAPGSTDALCATELSPDHRPVQKRETLREGRECLPESTWRSECSECRCSAEGYAVCSNTPCDGKLAPEPKRSCAPETRWKNDCNTCWCSGPNAACTLIGCLGKLDFGNFFKRDESVAASEPVAVTVSKEGASRKLRSVSTQETPKNCQPGKEFRLDCNKCLCDDYGQEFSCTRMDCNAMNNNNGGSRRKRETSVTVEGECVANSVFNKSCNACRCHEDGQRATCTNNLCTQLEEDNTLDGKPTVPESDSNFRCNPGEQFKKHCNDCTCSADGRGFFCTLRLCDVTLQ